MTAYRKRLDADPTTRHLTGIEASALPTAAVEQSTLWLGARVLIRSGAVSPLRLATSPCDTWTTMAICASTPTARGYWCSSSVPMHTTACLRGRCGTAWSCCRGCEWALGRTWPDALWAGALWAGALWAGALWARPLWPQGAGVSVLFICL